MPSFSRYTDSTINTFKKTNMYYESDPLIRYQDPAYIGFKLFFLFDQPNAGLLSTKSLKNTAMGYLEKIGDTERMDYLKSFVDLLQKINQVTPWFFQQIDGLDEAWKHMYQEKEYKPILSDRKIIINCLDESIDLRMTALMDLYRKACFDWPNRREVVPKNLRRFKVRIYCYEGRSLNRWGLPWSPAALGLKGAVEAAVPPILKQGKMEMDKWFGKDENSGFGLDKDGNADPLGAISSMFSRKKDTINDNISRVMFDFNYCEWLPDESNTLFSSISNKEFGLKAQKIAFSYENVEEDNIFRFFHGKKVSDFIIQTLDGLSLDKPDFLNKVPGFLGPYISGGIAQLATTLKSKLTGALNDLLLGNVYGFQPLLNATAIANGGVSGLMSAANEVGKNASKKNATFDTPGFNLGTQEKGSSMINMEGSNSAKSQGSSPENASLTNKTNDMIAITGNPYKNVFENKSLSNPSKDATNPIKDNPYEKSNSLINDNGPDAGKPNPFGNPNAYFDDFLDASLKNGKDKDPSGNVYKPLNLSNASKDAISPIKDNPYPDSKSINNGKDKDPKGNTYEPIIPYVEKDASGNYKDGSQSLTNDNGPDAKGQGASPQVSSSNKGGKPSGNAYN